MTQQDLFTQEETAAAATREAAAPEAPPEGRGNNPRPANPEQVALLH